MSGFFDTWGSEGASERAKEKEKKGQDYVEKPISMVGGRVLSDAEADARYAKTASKSELAKVQQRRQEALDKGYRSTSEMAYAEREDKPTSYTSTSSGSKSKSGSSSGGYYSPNFGSASSVSDYVNSLGLSANPNYTPGKTVDLSKYYDAVNQSKPTGSPKTYDLSKLFEAIGSRPDQVFSTSALAELLKKQQEAGGDAVAVDPAKYQTTEHLAELMKQMTGMLDPYTQFQKDTAQSAYGSAMQANDNKWASRGLAASGAAAAQAREGANALASQMAGIDATAQANALGQAFNYANLGLNEANQLFNQNMANRQFDQNRANSAVGNYLNSLGFQESQLQNWLGNYTNATGMDMSQNQWAQEFGHQQTQDYLRNLGNVTGMDVGQNQWSQQFGLDRQNSDFNRWRGASDFYEGQRQYDNNMNQRQYEFDTNMDQRQYEFDQNYSLDRDRFDFDKEKYAGDDDYRNRQLDYDYYTYDNDLAFDKQKYATEQTGRYMPDNAQSLLSQLGSLKQEAMNPANASNMSYYKQQGDNIRNQLAMMGVDTSKLGSDVSVSDYYRNAGQAGIPTQASKEWEYGKTRDKEDDRRWNLDYELKKQQQANNNQTTNSNIEQNTWERQQAEYKKQAAQQTTKYAMEILGKTATYDEAIGFLGSKAAELSSLGVDVGPLWDSIQAKYPKVAGSSQETPLQAAQRQKIEAEIKKMESDMKWNDWMMGDEASGG